MTLPIIEEPPFNFSCVETNIPLAVLGAENMIIEVSEEDIESMIRYKAKKS